MTPTGQSDRKPDATLATQFRGLVDVKEWRRRNTLAAGMDVLLLATTGFFGHMLVRTRLSAALAVIPMAAFLYFGWNSSKPFFLSQLVVIALTIGATLAGVSPI